MLSNTVLCVALCAPVTLVLQGCGGGGTTTVEPTTAAPTSSGSPSSSRTTTMTTTTTTWFAPPRTPGWGADEAVTTLNALFMEFDESNDSTAVGVTLSMASDPTSFSGNVFCYDFFPNQTCFKGKADCAMSASVMNHKVMIEQGHLATPIHSTTGIVLNQTMVETHFGKCAYSFDGAADRRVNNRCGTGAKVTGDEDTFCDNPLSAYKDMCWMNQPNHHCNRTDPEITNFYCKCEEPICSSSYGVATPPSDRSQAPCYYEMPAMWLDYENPSDETVTGTNHLRDSMKQRIVAQTSRPDQVKEWNEVIIDNRLLVPQMRLDPTHTILAIVYVPTTDGAHEAALQMRDEFQRTYRLDCDQCEIPVIAMNLDVNVTKEGGPFSAAPALRPAEASRSPVTV